MRELSEKDYQSMHGQVSIKSMYEKKKGKEVSLDHFLFTCHDTSKQLSELTHRNQEKHFWPGFEQDLSDLSLEEIIHQMLDWYKKKYPALDFKGVMDIGKMAHVAKSLALFERDFKALVKIKTGEHLEDHLLDQHELAPPWTYLKEHLNNSFSRLGDKIWTYFTWVYGISPPTELVPISDIPPVSRFRYQNHQDNRDRNHNNNNNRHNKLSSHPNHIFPPTQKNRSRPLKKPNDSFNQNQTNGASPKKRHKKPFQQSGEKNRKKEVLALVDEAIEELQTNNLPEILLTPQNSFYRRIQHKYIMDRGFISKSHGKEQKRAVKILARKT
ncbi:MAG: hypothetical protein OXC40_02315 [Proteobacteria bacterium]|nr:hypothetical protein [Pseudomonadota bacterium]